jgi:nickel-dependent lactate racemase
MTAGQGSPAAVISADQVKQIIEAGTPAALYEDKRVLVLTPDATRTCPLPMMIRAIREVIGARSAKLDFMVALGTHTPLAEKDLMALYGLSPQQRQNEFGRSNFFNHQWDRPATFTRLGRLEAQEVAEISGGLLNETVSIDINQKIYEYDLILILGPVFPHEVVGFSGGAKYLFPGISGGEFLHFFHWLGALVTCSGIIGIKDTPVRRVINRAVRHIDVPIHCLSMVVADRNRLCGCYAGGVEDAWAAAADLSARIHVVNKAKPFRVVFGRAPAMYDEIWVGGKVAYKLEQVVADGGTLIIYAPHIREISRTWGPSIEKIGYHVRDYFLAQMDRFKDIPRGVLAHSTHVRGSGSFQNGIEKPRMEVVLATAIPRATCKKINLGYLDPATIDVSAYKDKEHEGILFVDHAGEILYRLGA